VHARANSRMDEAEKVAHTLAMADRFPWVDVELLFR
jgi:hypothetical protein